jgi:hypothetical protein
MASLCVMLSLETKYIRYGILTHIVITILSLILNGFNFIFLLPYITFTGLCPIGNALFEKLKLPRIISYVLKQIWFTGSIIITAQFGAGFFNLKVDSIQSVLIIVSITVPLFFFYNLGMVNIRRKVRLVTEKNKMFL